MELSSHTRGEPGFYQALVQFLDFYWFFCVYLSELMGWMDQVEVQPVREHLLVQIEGVNKEEAVAWYCCKRMAYIYKTQTREPGTGASGARSSRIDS